MKIAKKSNRSFAVLLLVTSSSVASEELSKLEILEDYFSSGALCSTSEVVKLEANNNGLTVSLEIEPATRKALYKMPENRRDDWFSLHCPPEHHPVWANSNKRFDVTIAELLTPDANTSLESNAKKGATQTPQYNLSCLAYIEEQYSQRLSYRERVRLKIENLLNR
ncbi:MAG: hypothetical protein ACI9XK_000421 [Granulosicoccus sp.]|jgi:hypothetical protein